MNQLELNVYDHVIYPSHGLTVVKRIDEKTIAGSKHSFYVLQVLESQMTIMVPTEKARTVGLRKLIPESEIEDLWNLLRRRDVRIDQTTWNRRFREFTEKLKAGSILEIGEVLRDLYLLKGTKEHSFGERRLLEQAQKMIAQEVSLSLKIHESIIQNKLNDIFKDCR